MIESLKILAFGALMLLLAVIQAWLNDKYLIHRKHQKK